MSRLLDIIYMTKHESGDIGWARQAGVPDSDVSRIRNLMEAALAEELQRALGGSDIEHASYSLEAIAEMALDAALSCASAEGLTLQMTEQQEPQS